MAPLGDDRYYAVLGAEAPRCTDADLLDRRLERTAF